MSYISKISVNGILYDLRDSLLYAPTLPYNHTSTTYYPILGNVNVSSPESKHTYPRIAITTTTGTLNNTTKYTPQILLYQSTANNSNANTIKFDFPLTSTNPIITIPTSSDTTLLGTHNTTTTSTIDTASYVQIRYCSNDGKLYSLRGGGGGSGVSELSNLSDVSLSSLDDGHILQYDSEYWTNRSILPLDEQSSFSTNDIGTSYTLLSYREYVIRSASTSRTIYLNPLSPNTGEQYLLISNTDTHNPIEIEFKIQTGNNVILVKPSAPLVIESSGLSEVSFTHVSNAYVNVLIIKYTENLIKTL